MHHPKNLEPIRWVLYTREPASNFTQAMRVIGFYENSPIVEEFHKGMKTGLHIKQRQYESADHLTHRHWRDLRSSRETASVAGH